MGSLSGGGLLKGSSFHSLIINNREVACRCERGQGRHQPKKRRGNVLRHKTLRPKHLTYTTPSIPRARVWCGVAMTDLDVTKLFVSSTLSFML